MNEIDYWVSSSRGTCWVEVKDGTITNTANLWRKFIGQPFSNLTRWLRDAKVVQIGNGGRNV